MKQELLNVENLKTYFYTDSGVVKAVDDVTLNVKAGTTLALVGESGSGQSVLASSIMRLIPQPPGKIVSETFIYRIRSACPAGEGHAPYPGEQNSHDSGTDDLLNRLSR